MTNSFILGGMPVTLNTLTQIEYDHYKIHKDKLYSSGYYQGTVAAGGTMLLSINAGSIIPHVMIRVSAGGDAMAEFTEGGTITRATPLTVLNRNRNSSATCLSTCSQGGTLTGGTVICQMFVPGGSGPNAAGGGVRATNEFMCLRSKTSTLEVINITTAYPASVDFIWYEDNED